VGQCAAWVRHATPAPAALRRRAEAGCPGPTNHAAGKQECKPAASSSYYRSCWWLLAGLPGQRHTRLGMRSARQCSAGSAEQQQTSPGDPPHLGRRLRGSTMAAVVGRFEGRCRQQRSVSGLGKSVPSARRRCACWHAHCAGMKGEVCLGGAGASRGAGGLWFGRGSEGKDGGPSNDADGRCERGLRAHACWEAWSKTALVGCVPAGTPSGPSRWKGERLLENVCASV
jgi:hypothetical protein